MPLFHVSTDVHCFYPAYSSYGWIRAEDWGSVPWHSSRLQRIFSETRMLCIRKVCFKNMNLFSPITHVALLKCPDICYDNQQTDIAVLHCEQGACGQHDLLCVTPAALYLPFRGDVLMEIHFLARLKSTTPVVFWKFHTFAPRTLVVMSV